MEHVYRAVAADALNFMSTQMTDEKTVVTMTDIFQYIFSGHQNVQFAIDRQELLNQYIELIKKLSYRVVSLSIQKQNPGREFTEEMTSQVVTNIIKNALTNTFQYFYKEFNFVQHEDSTPFDERAVISFDQHYDEDIVRWLVKTVGYSVVIQQTETQKQTQMPEQDEEQLQE